MPPSFHIRKGFQNIIKEISDGTLSYAADDQLADYRYIEGLCLGIGMALRDLGLVQFYDPEAPSDIPEYMKNSEIIFSWQDSILETCVSIKNRILSDLDVQVPRSER